MFDGITSALPYHAPPADALADPFWDGIRSGVLRLPRCTVCGSMRWYLQPACSSCGTLRDAEWVDLPGTATLFTWTYVSRRFVDAPEPFHVGLLECDGAPGVRLVAPLAVEDRPTIGARMIALFTDLGGYSLPVFHEERSI